MRSNRAANVLAAYLLSMTTMSTVAAATDLNGGIWTPVAPPRSLKAVDGSPPPLRIPAKTASRASEAATPTEVARARKCLPPGVPRILLKSQPFEFLQRPEQLVILYQWNRMVRTVDMDVAQPELIGPAYLGQSVGRWSGDVLRIETIGFKDTTTLDEAGLPHGEKLSLVEEYRRTSHDTMEVTVTIDDPDFYTRPWKTRLLFRHEPGGRITEDVCLERPEE